MTRPFIANDPRVAKLHGLIQERHMANVAAGVRGVLDRNNGLVRKDRDQLDLLFLLGIEIRVVTDGSCHQGVGAVGIIVMR